MQIARRSRSAAHWISEWTEVMMAWRSSAEQTMNLSMLPLRWPCRCQKYTVSKCYSITLYRGDKSPHLHLKLFLNYMEITASVQQNLQPNEVKLTSIILITPKGKESLYILDKIEKQGDIKRLTFLIIFQILARKIRNFGNQ